MGENCCLCFPLECGVKVIAFFSILGTIGVGVQSYTDPTYWNIFWPIVCIMALMSVMWIYAMVNSNEGSRKAAFFVYFFGVFIAASAYYGYAILNGKAVNWYCNAERVDQMNSDIQEFEDGTGTTVRDSYTVESCTADFKSWFWVDFAFKVLIQGYFSHVIARWSKNENEFIKY